MTAKCNPLTYVHDDSLRGLVDRLDDAAVLIDEVLVTADNVAATLERSDIEEIVASIKDAADYLAEQRLKGRLP